ncbi:MAG: hypothetical protein JNM78_13440 [Cyclobacteriaceae bacterium]|nr:hypothetical protein [Cyclobacteriaceae bacterium]
MLFKKYSLAIVGVLHQQSPIPTLNLHNDLKNPISLHSFHKSTHLNSNNLLAKRMTPLLPLLVFFTNNPSFQSS